MRRRGVAIVAAVGLSAAMAGAARADLYPGAITNLSQSLVAGLFDTVSRSMTALLGERIDVTGQGAVGDMIYLPKDIYIASGSNALTINSASFTAAMVGKAIIVPGAGANGAALVTTIASLTNSSTAVLGANAGTTEGTSPTSLTSAAVTLEIGTDNTAAINAALAIARARNMNSGSIISFDSHVVCAQGEYLTLGAINLTGFTNTSVYISGPGCVIHSANAGGVAVDMMSSRFMALRDLTIEGDYFATPKIGLQLGRDGPTAGTNANSADNNSIVGLNVEGKFTLAAALDEQSETGYFQKSNFSNQYQTGYGFIADGFNYFGATSTFVTNNEPTATNEAFGEPLFVSSTFAASTPIELAGTTRATCIDCYTTTYGSYSIVFRNEPGDDVTQANMDIHAESADQFGIGAVNTAYLLITGTDPVPIMEGVRLRDNGMVATQALIKVDPASSITRPTLPSVTIDMPLYTGAPGATNGGLSILTFADPQLWTPQNGNPAVSGQITVPDPANFNLACPAFQGTLTPIDAAPSTCYSLVSGPTIAASTVLTAPGFTVGGDPQGGLVLGSSASGANPHLDFFGYGSTADARLLNNGAGQLELDTNGAQNVVFASGQTVFRQPIVATGGATFPTSIAQTAKAGLAAVSITIPASGTPPTGATQLAAHLDVVTACSSAAAGASGQPVQLPAGSGVAGEGYDVVLLNRSGAACAVYPPSGGTIETGAPNAPVVIAAGADATFRSTAAGAWWQ